MANFSTPHADLAAFEKSIKQAVEGFPSNAVCQRIVEGTADLNLYHSLLRLLFHQVYNSSTTFALAGANLPPERNLARNYLIKHAEEEMEHWRWIQNDLTKAGYKGASPESEFPHPVTQSYVSFNYYLAQRFPIARLGVALMLETLGGTLGKRYIKQWCDSLKLSNDQAVFFFGHGDTDVVHSQEIKEVIINSALTPSEWGWMKHAVECSYFLYFQIYQEAAKCS